ncbi:MAG: hypothetical protein AAGL11_12435, partial [Pseudomonadota bacterium]
MSKRSEEAVTPVFELIGGDRPRLVLQGDWVVMTLASVDEKLRSLPETVGHHSLSEVDVSGIDRLDTAGAFLIDRTLRNLGGSPHLVGAGEEITSLLSQARTLATQEEHAPPVIEPGHGFVDLLERTGRNAEHLWEEALETLAFLGGTLVAILQVIW